MKFTILFNSLAEIEEILKSHVSKKHGISFHDVNISFDDSLFVKKDLNVKKEYKEPEKLQKQVLTVLLEPEKLDYQKYYDNLPSYIESLIPVNYNSYQIADFFKELHEYYLGKLNLDHLPVMFSRMTQMSRSDAEIVTDHLQKIWREEENAKSPGIIETRDEDGCKSYSSKPPF